jgi:3'(2'), 5'-bisphosphate nucleotidase
MKTFESLKEDMWKVAIPAALKAGEAILEVYYSEDFGQREKADKSPLTEADLRAHRCIQEALEKTPYPILSEEGRDIPYEERQQWEAFWMVDPLDGTKEFIKRNGEFTVNIALISKGIPVCGLVYVPVSRVLYLGLGPGEAWRLEVPSSFGANESFDPQHLAGAIKLPEASRDTAFRVVASRSHMNAETGEFIRKLEEIYPEVRLTSRGSSLKICMVAEGAADIYPRFAPTMEWDTAAGQAVAEAAGMEMLDYQSKKPLRYNKPSLLNPWFVVQRRGSDREG